MARKNFFRSVKFAFSGIASAFREEHSFRIQCVAGGVVLAAIAVFPVAPAVRALVAFVVAVVLSLELLNTAIERLADAVTEQPHPKIKEAKDMTAGSVFVVAAGALAVAAILLFSMPW